MRKKAQTQRGDFGLGSGVVTLQSMTSIQCLFSRPCVTLLAAISLFLTACSEQPGEPASRPAKPQAAVTESLPECIAEVTEPGPGPGYQFFVAGHAYGSPNAPQHGLYPPFQSQAEALNTRESMLAGILTGDVVYEADARSWDAVEADMQAFTMPLYIAPGNHDRGDQFDARFPERYLSFEHAADLFLVLDTENWRVEGEQLEFLQAELAREDWRHIFVFTHEVVWWSPNNRFNTIATNNRATYPGSSNFWTVVAPLLMAHEGEVVVYAGDVGAFAHVTPFSADEHCNLTLITSGMGGGAKDNIVITQVDSSGEMSFELLPL